MRVGVVCEGVTDFIAISIYMREALLVDEIDIEFIALQPDVDATQPKAGWGQVENWLNANDFDSRVQRYWGGGLFDGNMDEKNCDAFLIQMDTDHFADPGFRVHIEKTFPDSVVSDINFDRPYDAALCILEYWSRCVGTISENSRHAFVPSVMSIETWCSAAFKNHGVNNIESINGSELTNIYMNCLHLFEGRPESVFNNICKRVGRRKRYCEATKENHSRISQQCPSFSKGLQAVRNAHSAV